MTTISLLSQKRNIAILHEEGISTWRHNMSETTTKSLRRGSPKRKALAAALGAVLCPTLAHAEPLSSFSELAAKCAPWIHPTTLSAVVMQESAGNPLAIGINGGARLPRQPKTKAEAIATARLLKERGLNFDAGLGQINVKNLSWLGMSVEDLFDPCINLRGAGMVLSDCYTRASGQKGQGQPALMAALSCYNTGDFGRGLRNGYVGKVTSRVGASVPAVASQEALVTASRQAADHAPQIPEEPKNEPREWSKEVFADAGSEPVEIAQDSKAVSLR